MFGMLKHELKASARRKLGAILAQYAFRAIKKRMDPESHGGAPLLGFHGLIMKVHASSRERAIANAIHISAQNHKHKVNQLIATEIATANERISATVADSKADLPA
jgi:glycerol-3-phosphate acyltransferase PlsX